MISAASLSLLEHIRFIVSSQGDVNILADVLENSLNPKIHRLQDVGEEVGPFAFDTHAGIDEGKDANSARVEAEFTSANQ